jgi:hypothetical protein
MTTLEFYHENNLKVQNMEFINERWSEDEVWLDGKGLHVIKGGREEVYSPSRYHIEKGFGKFIIKRRS